MRHPFIACTLATALLVGCASSQPQLSAEEWFNQESQRWVDAVASSCSATHQNYIQGISPVDCESHHPDHLNMSFPNREFFVKNEHGVAEYLSAWCVAVSNRYGQMSRVNLELREEEASFNRGCLHILNRTRGTQS